MFELAIIGGGPAGLSAAIQAKKYKIETIVIAADLGGKIKNAHSIENWPGDYGISGEDLSDKFVNHIVKQSINVAKASVKDIVNHKDYFKIHTDNEEFSAKRIILAIGNEQNKLDIEGEEKFFKKGVSYKANKDGKNYRDKVVAVVGSGDSACTSAIFLADIAKKVYLMYRSQNLKAEPIWIEKVKSIQNIELLPGLMPVKILGNGMVNKLICSDGSSLNIEAIFIEIGFKPSIGSIKNLGLSTDQDGFVVVDKDQKTNIKNIWAAGDLTTNSGKFRQIVTAASEGTVALNSVYKDINNITP